ncbi:hypothetical protein KIPB_015267 [Kipferlia bialata]|uniref:Uncharacterized protein n=1 Tax=Kipferlia bialata TaxID=797122 RepID=A0A391NW20_9EUKA|nr:hypothetical protein KIPB_015267 [Kipferlia bialata]|eukprot:g15267.t1
MWNVFKKGLRAVGVLDGSPAIPAGISLATWGDPVPHATALLPVSEVVCTSLPDLHLPVDRVAGVLAECLGGGCEAWAGDVVDGVYQQVPVDILTAIMSGHHGVGGEAGETGVKAQIEEVLRPHLTQISKVHIISCPNPIITCECMTPYTHSLFHVIQSYSYSYCDRTV